MSTNKQELSRIDSLLMFFLITFGITWGIWIPQAIRGISTPWVRLGTFGPALAALILTAVREGKQGLQGLIGKLTHWKEPLGWYLIALLLPIPVVLLAIKADEWLGGPTPRFNDPSQLYLVIPVFLFVLFFSVAGEELGWRGYALPRFLRHWSALKSSLALGLIWGAWHLPLFWMPGDFHTEIPLIPFLLQILASSIIYTWIFINTRGSLLLAHLFHAASNTALGVLPLLPMDTSGRLRPLWIAVGLWCLLAGLITIFTGPDLRFHQD